MFNRLKNVLSVPQEELKKADPVDLTLAVCVILLEIARADDEFSAAEHYHIISTLTSHFNLSTEEAEGLIQRATQAREDSLDLWNFTHKINEIYDLDQRREMMQEIWRVIFADGTLDAHEDYLVRKLANLLRLRHSDMIAAKVAILRELKKP